MKFEQSITRIIKKRRSVRSYSDAVIMPETEGKIRQILSSNATGPMGNAVSFYLVNRKVARSEQGIKLGTYGFIKGAQHFVAGEVGKNPFAEEDYGYLLEKIILHLTELDLGTCWLGGTFKRREIAHLIQPSPGAVIPAITPLGYAAPSMSNREHMIRKGAKADQRKPWEELFFDRDFKEPLDPEAAETFATPLEMVRLAPSASNKQPWRILRKDQKFHFFLARTPGYGVAFKGVDLQRIDMGIAMAHFELTCRESGLEGNWKHEAPGIPVPAGLQYMVSWT